MTTRGEQRHTERIVTQLRALPEGILLTAREIADALDADPGVNNRRLSVRAFGEAASFQCPFCKATGTGFMTLSSPGGTVRLTLPEGWAFSGTDGHMCRECVPAWSRGEIGTPTERRL